MILVIIVKGVLTGLDLHGVQILYYFASTIFTMISFDLLKIMFSHKLRKVVTENVLTKLFRITGVILMALGIFVIIRAFWH